MLVGTLLDMHDDDDCVLLYPSCEAFIDVGIKSWPRVVVSCNLTIQCVLRVIEMR